MRAQKSLVWIVAVVIGFSAGTALAQGPGGLTGAEGRPVRGALCAKLDRITESFRDFLYTKVAVATRDALADARYERAGSLEHNPLLDELLERPGGADVEGRAREAGRRIAGAIAEAVDAKLEAKFRTVRD